MRRAHLGRAAPEARSIGAPPPAPCPVGRAEDTTAPPSARLWARLWVHLAGCRRSSAPPPPPTPPSAPSPVLAAATLAATLARAAAPLLRSGGRLCPLRGDGLAVARPLGRGCSHGHLVDVRRQGGGWWQDAEGADEGGGDGGERASPAACGEGTPPEGDRGRMGLAERRRAGRRACCRAAGRGVGRDDERSGERARGVRRRLAEGQVREEGKVIRGEARGGQAVLEANRVLRRQLQHLSWVYMGVREGEAAREGMAVKGCGCGGGDGGGARGVGGVGGGGGEACVTRREPGEKKR